jgi:uncharacterized protein YgiM (DUF1202 family)
MLLVLAICASASAAWIKTENGKAANGRGGPGKDYPLIATVAYGREIVVTGGSQNGYTPIMLPSGSDEVWVLSRFIVNYNPGKYTPSPKPDSGKSSGNKSDAQNSIYAEFKAARWVNPYEVTTYHKRSSGTINMRWAPAKNAPLIQSYRSGESLTVLCELKDWYQVEDPETGKVGFIRRDFLQK